MTLYSGSGEVRDYQGDTAQPTYKTIWLPLRSIHRTNGYRHQFSYDNGKAKQGVTLFTPANKAVAYYCSDDRGDKLQSNPLMEGVSITFLIW